MPTDFEVFRDRTQAKLFELLPAHTDRLGWDRTRIAAEQRDQCRDLLAFAREHSPFHARRLVGVDPDTFELDGLARLPIMTKTDLMASFDDVVTDRRVTRAATDAAIASTVTVPHPIAGDFIVLTSGGTSGVRGTFVFDVDTFATFAATLMRQMMARMQAAGGPPPGGVQLAMVGAESPIHATGVFPCMLEGFPVSCVSVPVTLPIGSIVERLNQLQPPVLYGYASMLARLAAEQRSGWLHIAPAAVTATGETLRGDLRRAIADGFDVPIVNTYGSSEGLTGVSAPDDLAVTFADDCCIVELVDEQGRPVEPGEPSAAVLVTNLYNRVQPLIRYRIDDRFVRGPDAPEHGHLRAEVEGRASDVLRFGNVVVHPHVITTHLAHSASIVDYQVRQVERGVAVSVVATDDLDTAAVAAHVRSGLAAAGVGDATVQVEAVRELPRDPRTGKLTSFVPLRTA